MRKNCSICSQLRELDFHLYELSQFCLFLGNSKTYSKQVKGNTETYTVRTDTIGNWLKLASKLEKIDINPWKFGNGGFLMCGTAADHIERDSSYDESYSTIITKFFFVQNAIEETYRFLVPIHDSLPENQSNKSKNKNNTEKAFRLINSLGESDFLDDFEHYIGNLNYLFGFYRNIHKITINNTYLYSRLGDNNYGVDIIRNIRNDVLHGTFPFILEAYSSNQEQEIILLIKLLEYSCRISALYIQVLLCKFNDGFESYDYLQIQSAHGDEFYRFREHCTIEYGKKLHLQNEFSFENSFGD